MDPLKNNCFREAKPRHIETDGVHAALHDKAQLSQPLRCAGKRKRARKIAAQGVIDFFFFLFFLYFRSTNDEVSEALKRLKGELLLQFILRNEISQALIFVRTRLDADNLEKFLKMHSKDSLNRDKFSCRVLHSGRNVPERRANLQAFKDNEVKFLICTDVAARGIDVQQLPFVINFTLPDEVEPYIHRIGRVGRAECVGLSVSFVAAAAKERVWYHSCRNASTCSARALKAKGGCTIDYDEPALFAAIQERLGETVRVLPESMKIADDADLQGLVFGKKRKRDENAHASVKAHMAEIGNEVSALAAIDTQLQQNFFTLQNKIF